MKKGIVGFFIGMTITAMGFSATQTSMLLVTRNYKPAKRFIRQKLYKAGQSFSYSMSGVRSISLSAIPAGQELDAICVFEMREAK